MLSKGGISDTKNTAFVPMCLAYQSGTVTVDDFIKNNIILIFNKMLKKPL